MSARSPTRTRIFLNLSSAELSAELARLPCDGVGPMRAEKFALSLGVHPRKLLADSGEETLIQLFSDNIRKVADDFAPRQVIYRTLDLKPDEYAGLEGGAAYEVKDGKSLLGLRGTSRYLADPESFRMELRAVKRARESGCVNVDVMLPFVRVPEELGRCREMVIEEGLFASAEFELWMMAEMASNAQMIDELIPHVTGVCIDSNELAQLMPEMDGDTRRPEAQLGEPHPAVLAAIERIARACRARRAACSICGDTPLRFPEVIPKMLESGLTGISVAPESFEAAVRGVAEAEALLGIGN